MGILATSPGTPPPHKDKNPNLQENALPIEKVYCPSV